MLKQSLRTVFGSLGLDVRFKSNLEAARVAAKRQARIDRWKLLHRYRPNAILDIGANEGQFAHIIRQTLPETPLYSFEPLPDCFEKLNAYLESSGPGRAFPFALGNSNGSSVIHRSEFSPSSSLLKMATLHKEEFPETANTFEQEIQIRRLDDLADELPLDSPFVVKVDVQGFENDVIAGGADVLSRSSAIVMELTSYPLYEDQSTFESVFDVLRSLGMVFRGTVDQMHSPNDGRILQFDALFENPSRIDADA